MKNPVAARRLDTKHHPKLCSLNYNRLSELHHENIIKLHDTHVIDNITWMFTELCEFGDLNMFYEGREVPLDTSKEIMQQTINGIAYLHDRSIIHRDIKPANILVASKQPIIVKLSDFDVSKFLDPEIETSVMSSNVGTSTFKAPEFFLRRYGKLKYHRNVDVYAAGLTFLAIVQHDREKRMLGTPN